MVEFTCEGCGAHVGTVGIEMPPEHGFCAGCLWFSAFGWFYSDADFMRARRLLMPALPGRAEARYHDPRCEPRACDRCGKPYRGPALYCSLACAFADAE